MQEPIYVSQNVSLPPVEASLISPAEEELFRSSLAAANVAANSTNSGSGLWLLISMVLFAATQLGGFNLTAVAIITGVILFHEAGHYAGMQLFGYRDVRMFFIPFFGAAVTGKKYAAPAWQQVIVLLLGPLPGILLAMLLFLVLQPRDLRSVPFEIILTLLGINAFNLLPLMPLDGGRIIHVLLFRRHPILEVFFGLFAMAGLAGIALLLGSWLLGVLALLVALGIPFNYRVARRAQALRASLPSVLTPWPQLGEPEQFALFQLARQMFPQDRQPPSIGKRVLLLHESAAASSPGWLATLAFLGLYGVVMIAIPIFVLVIVFQQQQLEPQKNQQQQRQAQLPDHVYVLPVFDARPG